jgi:transposase-like protein
MGQVLHGSATTTAAVRRAIQHSQESLRALAKRLGINPKTVAKWRKRASASDLPTGPKEPRSTVLPVEAVVVAFRRHSRHALGEAIAFIRRPRKGSVKANKYRRFSASNPAERGGNSSAKTAQL